MEDEPLHEEGHEIGVETAKPKLQLPRQYKVLLINDDYTPMEFVVDILERFFDKDRRAATRIMLEVHTRGSGVCGLFPRDIAETKVFQVDEYSKIHEHPLLCTMEEA